METTSNIPATGWSVRANQATDERRHVQFNMEAEFSFSHFAVKQLLFGELHSSQGEYTGDIGEESLFKKLAIYSLDATDVNHLPIIPLNRDEVKILRKWLETRMAHCEKERDERTETRMVSLDAPDKLTPKFNPDTYIAQKFLLLDIREWLAGDIID